MKNASANQRLAKLKRVPPIGICTAHTIIHCKAIKKIQDENIPVRFNTETGRNNFVSFGNQEDPKMKKAKVKLKALMDEDSDENSDFEKELAKGNRLI